MDNRFAGSAYRYFLLWGICASLVTTVCTLTDSFLVGNLVGSDGLAVSNLSTPVYLIYALLGITVGVGANVHISRSLGAGNAEEANDLFSRVMGLGLILGAVMLLPLFFKRAYFSFLGVTGELYPLAEQYLTVVMWAAPFFIIYHILAASVRSDSDPKIVAAASGVVIGVNVVLDIVFMQFLGWGIIGASASLCIAECLGAGVLLCHFFRKNRLLHLRVKLPGIAFVRRFVFSGFGIGSANVFAAVVMLVFNTILMRSEDGNGAVYVAIYGVIYTVSTIPMGVFDGASTSLSTVTAFLTGESDRTGIFTVLKWALCVTAAVGGIMADVCSLNSSTLVELFGIRDTAALAHAARAMGIFALSIILTGLNVVITAFWQAIGRASFAGAMSFLRNFLIMLVVGVICLPRWGIVGVGITYLATEAICLLMVLIVMLVSPSRRYVTEKYSPRGRCFEKSYEIATDSMEQISGDLERLCDEWEIGMKQAFFINFICEELLLNIIKFGLEGSKKKEHYISIRLMEKNGDYVLRVRDNVNSYNPFESSGDEIDSGVLMLIRKKTKYCDYQRKMIFNYLYMII